MHLDMLDHNTSTDCSLLQQRTALDCKPASRTVITTDSALLTDIVAAVLQVKMHTGQATYGSICNKGIVKCFFAGDV